MTGEGRIPTGRETTGSGRLGQPLPGVMDSNFSLLRHLQGVFDLDTEVSDCAFQLCVSKQQLYGTEILRLSVSDFLSNRCATCESRTDKPRLAHNPLRQ
jgi:DICT domain-containing protein